MKCVSLSSWSRNGHSESPFAMLLEAGLKKDDDKKPLRPSLSSSISSGYVRYERWVKLIGFTTFGCWMFFVLVYTTMGSPLVGRDVGDREHDVTMQSYENAFPDETRFIVIGDYGTGDQSQIKVAEALKFHAVTLEPKPAFVISTGDQIYEHGITSAQDKLLVDRFEKMYAHPVLSVPWYITIGNHDCEGSIDAMLEYASTKQSLWYFPRRYYTIHRPVAPKTVLRIVVVDACDLVCGHEPRNVRCKNKMNEQSSEQTRLEQYEWIEQQLRAEKPAGVERMWTVVVGHWAVYSYAGNADTPELIKSLDPLLKKYKVHAYINGHDHCMQHIKRYDNEHKWMMNYFVSGAGGYRVHDLKPKARANPDLVHAAMTHGFMSVLLTRDVFRIQMIDATGDVLYTTDVPYEQ